MKRTLATIGAAILLGGLLARGEEGLQTRAGEMGKKGATNVTERIVRTDAEWRAILTPEQYRILRGKGTECAFTGRYHDFKGQGVFRCAGCGHVLFATDAKFDSGTGWPSFWKTAAAGAIETRRDTSHGMVREEALCARCGSHLGHVFADGPKPSGLRYCINSAALTFEAQDGP